MEKELNNMKVINLIGAPGAGKSTTAASLFSLMKLHDLKTELVTEYAKDLVYEGRLDRVDQNYIFAKQYRRLSRLEGQVDYAVTDSPLRLGVYYALFSLPMSFVPFARDIIRPFEEYNFFINRVKTYQEYGRAHKEEESDKIARDLKYFLENEDVEYYTVGGDMKAAETILMKLVDLDNGVKEAVERGIQTKV